MTKRLNRFDVSLLFLIEVNTALTFDEEMSSQLNGKRMAPKADRPRAKVRTEHSDSGINHSYVLWTRSQQLLEHFKECRGRAQF